MGCTDYELLAQQHLDPGQIEHAVLVHGAGPLVPAKSVAQLTIALARAIND